MDKQRSSERDICTKCITSAMLQAGAVAAVSSLIGINVEQEDDALANAAQTNELEETSK